MTTPHGIVWWPHEATKRLVVLVVTTLALLFARLQIMGSQLPVFTRFDNPASVSPTPTRQLTYNYLASVNLWLLLFPCDLCCDWTMGTVPLVESISDVRNLGTLAGYLLIGTLVWISFTHDNRQKAAVIIMGLAFMILPFLPASNLFFPVGFVIAERVLYMPSMGFCILVAYGFHLLSEKWSKKCTWSLLGLLLLSHSLKTYTRNYDWENEYSIFMSGLKVNQRNAKLFNNVGHALEAEGDFVRALEYFHKAVEVQEDDVGAHINVGRTYNHLKMFKEAEEAYLRAKSLLPKAKPGESYQARIAPNHLNVFLNLANLISKNHTRLEEADMLYRQAISMRADYTQAYINRGDILIKLNRTKEAQEVYERALLYDSTNPDIYYNLGVVFLEQGKASQALAYLDKALEFDPEHEQALLNSAILLQELGRAELRKIARERLLKLLAKDDENERVYFNLGMLAMDDHKTEEAEHWFRRAVHLKIDFRSALFNLALLLADDHRPLEAAPFLNQLVKHHPDHTKGLILLGDIYINNIKDLDAAENCYKRILQLDPVNIQGLHNLCVVYVERGKLAQAQACLSHAHQLAPTEDYILKHLQIVQTRINRLKSSSGMEKEKEIAFAEFDPNEFGGGIAIDINTIIMNNDKAFVGTTTTKTATDNTITEQKQQNYINSNDGGGGFVAASVIPSATGTSSFSGSKKAQLPPTAPQSSQIAEPIFIESEAMSSKIHDDYHYRPSNSGHSNGGQTMSRNINSNFHYNRKVIKSISQQHHHVTNTRKARQQQLGSDLDDPSSGMS
uniref:dolichyl-phosphate-mannose--protein mannosyltransferase n=1 Tax=Culicoides sonorensis TaxID=179676 RepID=A0A336KWY0_CULSO